MKPFSQECCVGPGPGHAAYAQIRTTFSNVIPYSNVALGEHNARLTTVSHSVVEVSTTIISLINALV